MKLIQEGDSNNQVIFLQKLLQKEGHSIPSSGKFDKRTDMYVKEFQKKHGLKVDGLVGRNTWMKLLDVAYNFSLGYENYFLNDNEWVKEITEKDTIYLHHTAGRYNPKKTIDWWEIDTNPKGRGLWRIGTAFVIGRASRDCKDLIWDGRVIRAFNEIHWAYHLGVKGSKSKLLNQKSIGIELCSLGGLHLEEGEYLFKSKNGVIKVPEDNVVKLDIPWRGFSFFQKYTDKQIESCEKLILTLSFLFDIPIVNKPYSQTSFEIDNDALNGCPGIWNHCNVRSDKIDCFPQTELLAMLNGLYEKSKSFVPEEGNLESASLSNLPKENFQFSEIENYSYDLMDINR
ncbi:peptidoglycan-binding protein [Ulvibacterium sp.]|uniref:peptidoglycan-binding protein n=1 Tax=Ulvibacterium sp. TaxID=2665914 RepID=UPI003CC5F161